MLYVTRSYNVSYLKIVCLYFPLSTRCIYYSAADKIKYPESKQHNMQNLCENKPKKALAEADKMSR